MNNNSNNTRNYILNKTIGPYYLSIMFKSLISELLNVVNLSSILEFFKLCKSYALIN